MYGFTSFMQNPGDMPQDKLDYYSILGVARGATAKEIQDAYRQRAKMLHPDRGGSIQEFQMLQKAYNTLSKEASRNNYDNRFSKTHYEMRQQQEFTFPPPDRRGGGTKKGGFNHAAFAAEREQIVRRQQERDRHIQERAKNHKRPGKEHFAKRHNKMTKEQIWQEKYVLGVDVDDGNDDKYSRKKAVYLSERDAFKSPENVFNGRFDRNAFNRHFEDLKKETESKDLIIYEEPSPTMTVYSGSNFATCGGSQFAEFSSDPDKICNNSTVEMAFRNPGHLSKNQYKSYLSQPDITKVDTALTKKELEERAMKHAQSISEFGSSTFRNHKKSRRERKGGIHGDLFPAEDEPLHEEDYADYSD